MLIDVELQEELGAILQLTVKYLLPSEGMCEIHLTQCGPITLKGMIVEIRAHRLRRPLRM